MSASVLHLTMKGVVTQPQAGHAGVLKQMAGLTALSSRADWAACTCTAARRSARNCPLAMRGSWKLRMLLLRPEPATCKSVCHGQGLSLMLTGKL